MGETSKVFKNNYLNKNHTHIYLKAYILLPREKKFHNG